MLNQLLFTPPFFSTYIGALLVVSSGMYVAVGLTSDFAVIAIFNLASNTLF